VRRGLIGALALVVGCGPSEADLEAIRDPETCRECHPDHVREWSGSMHAYASEDPIFRALNALGQVETDGELGDFCVRCHAPLAVELGLTSDGLNLDEIDPSKLGVPCVTCHQVDGVEGTHNNPLTFALDRTLRGPIADPRGNPVHESRPSPFVDSAAREHSDVCGSCHDIVTPLGAHIERTYAEWKGSIYADPQVGLGCARCHMPGRDDVVANVPGAPIRRRHDHRMPGVDIALTPFPERDDQRAAVQEFLDDTLLASLCVQPPEGPDSPTLAVVQLDNLAAGHAFPSGATAERRVWVELTAFTRGEVVWSTGAVEPGEPLGDDPARWDLHSAKSDPDGAFTHRFWEASAIDESGLLQPHTTLDPSDPAYIDTVQTRQFVIPAAADRVTMALHVRPMPLDLLGELVELGLLDPAVVEAMPTWTLAPTRLEWTADQPLTDGPRSCVGQ